MAALEALPPELLSSILDEFLDPVSATCLSLTSKSLYSLFNGATLKSYSFTNLMVTYGYLHLLEWASKAEFPISLVEVLKQACVVGSEEIFDWAVQTFRLGNNMMEDKIFLTSLSNIASRHNQLQILDLLRLRFDVFPSRDTVEDFPYPNVVKWYAEHAPEWDLSNETVIERAAEINQPDTLSFMKERHCHIGTSAILYPAAKHGYIEIIEWASRNNVVPPHFDYGYYFQRALFFLKLDAARYFYSLGVSIDKKKFIPTILLPLVRNRTKNLNKVVTLLKYLIEEIGCELDDRFHIFAARFPAPDILQFGYKYNQNLEPGCFREAIRTFRRVAKKNNEYSSFFVKQSTTVLMDQSPLKLESFSVFQFLVDVHCPVPDDFFLFCLKELVYVDAYIEEDSPSELGVEEDSPIEVFYHTQIFQILDYLVHCGIRVSESGVRYATSIGWNTLNQELARLFSPSLL